MFISSASALLASEDEEKSELPSAPQMPAFELFGPGDMWSELGREPSLDVGVWLEYRQTSAHQADSMVRISVVPQSELPSEEHRVVEIRMIEPTGDRNYVRMLLTGVDDGARRLEALQIKQASLPLLDLPVGGQSADRVVSPAAEEAEELRSEEVGVVEVETPVGTFECRHVRLYSGEEKDLALEVWIDTQESVPLWGIVKSRQGGRTALLASHGDGARSDLPPIRTD